MEEERKCSVCGKLASRDNGFNFKRMLCNRHYLQFMKHGKFLDTDCVYNPDRNYWSKDEDELLEQLYSQEASREEISNKLNRTISECASRAHRLGLTDKYVKHNSAKFKAIYQDYDWCFERFINRSMSMEEMAIEAQCTLRVMQKWCSERHGLNTRTYRKFKKLSDKQKEIITVGTLGDGHIDNRETQPMYIESHAEDEKDYMFWKYDFLKDICNNPPAYYDTAFTSFGTDKKYECQPYYRINSRILDDLYEIRSMNRVDKIINLTEFQICLLLLDDGSRDSLWHLCVAEWTENEKHTLLNVCEKKFKIKGSIQKDDRYISFDAFSSIKIDEMILGNVPNDLDIIQKKILSNDNIRTYRHSFYILTNQDKIGLASYCKQHHIKFEDARDIVWGMNLDFPEMKEEEFLRIAKEHQLL